MREYERIGVKSAGANLAVTRYFSEATDTVILLHGGPGMPDDFTDIVDQLLPQFQVMTFDQRGQGGSLCRSGDYSMEAYAGDLKAIIHHFDLDGAHLFGHSWGGLYAQLFAQLQPGYVKSLFLCSPSAGTGIHWKLTQSVATRYAMMRTGILDASKMGFYLSMARTGSDWGIRRLYRLLVKAYNKDFPGSGLPEVGYQKIHAEATMATLKRIGEWPELEGMEELIFPVMVTFGENDIYGNVSQFVYERFPTAKFVTVPRSGHYPWRHNPAFFNSVLADFYGSVAEQG